VNLHDVETLDADERREQELLDELADRGYRVAVQCRRCGLWLSNPRSVARHIGPKCRKATAGLEVSQ